MRRSHTRKYFENVLFLILPFKAQEDTGVPSHRNINSILKEGIIEKISKNFEKNERRAYESVDEKSLS